MLIVKKLWEKNTSKRNITIGRKSQTSESGEWSEDVAQNHTSVCKERQIHLGCKDIEFQVKKGDYRIPPTKSGWKNEEAM